jgi:hypothetical protein
VDGEELVCARDGAPTRLRCAGCQAGICPACLVRTPVGHKCRACAGQVVERRRSHPVGPLAVAGAGVVVLLATVVLLRPSGDATSSDPVAIDTAPAERVATTQVMIGEEARDGQLVFVVEDFGCAAKEVPAGATPGKLCTLRFTVKNGSTSPAALLGRFQYLVDARSKTYGADEALTRAASQYGERGLSELNINPDVVVPLTFVFDVPEAVEIAEAQFRGNGRSRFGVNVLLQRRA